MVFNATINIISVIENPTLGKVYSIQHYVIKFVSDLRQVCGFLRALRFPPPIKVSTTILLKVVLNTITPNPLILKRKSMMAVIIFISLCKL